MEKDQISVRNHWESQGREYQGEIRATSSDPIAYRMETEELLKHLSAGQRVLSVGCGNGLRELEICSKKKVNIDGIDYSIEMIEAAKKNLSNSIESKKMIGEVKFYEGDVLNLSIDNRYDMAYSCRCLINLGSHDLHIKAIDNILGTLKPQGTYLMIEGTKQGLEEINTVRETFSLHHIEECWYNVFLDEKKIENHIREKGASVDIINFNSTYYLISRTINALMTKPGDNIDVMSLINEYASKLPAVGSFSPLKLFKITLG